MTYKVINIDSKYKYLSEVLDSGVYPELTNDLPDNTYIDKVLCGCGATTAVLQNNVDYVVAIPFKALGDNKKVQADMDRSSYPYEIFVFHSEIEQLHASFLEYLERNKDNVKKVMVTYDSISKLRNFIDFKDYKLFIDEGHKLLEYAGNFKPKVVNDLLKIKDQFKAYTIVTATPTREEYIPVQLSNTPKIKLQWSSTTQVSFNHCRINQNQVRSSILSLCLSHLREETEGNMYFFINSVSTIASICKDLLKKYKVSPSDIKVVCAKTDNNIKLLSPIKLEPKAVIEPNDNRFYKINFITSTAFEGQDFLDPLGVTYILSDGKLEHTKLDISTQVSQIVGRLRVSKFKDKVNMLWTSSPTNGFNTEEEYKEYVLEQEQDYLKAIQDFNNASSTVTKKALITIAKTSPYLIEDEEEFSLEINPNAVNHLMNSFIGTTMQYYVSLDEVKQKTDEDKVTFTLCDVFSGQVKNNFKLPELSPKDKRLLGRKSNFGTTVKQYLDTLYGLRSGLIQGEHRESFITWMKEIQSDGDYEVFFDYVEKFGIDDLTQLNASSIRESTLAKRLEDYYQKQSAFLVLKSSFDSGVVIPATELKDTIQSLYSEYNINLKAKATDIEIAFFTKDTIKTVSGKKVKAIKLLRKKNKYA